MNTADYYLMKQTILDKEDLSERQKNVLVTDLKHEYFGVDRSGLINYLDTANLKAGIIQVINE